MVPFSRIISSAAVAVMLFAMLTPSSAQVQVDFLTLNSLLDIVNTNNGRQSNQRIATAFIYLFVALGMFFLASELAVLMGWLYQPLNVCLRRNPRNSEAAMAKWNGLMWWWLFIAILFIISGATGLPGWLVVCCFEAFCCLCIYLVLIILHCCCSPNTGTVNTNKVEPALGAGQQQTQAEEDPTLIKDTRVAFETPAVTQMPTSADTRVRWSRFPQRIGATQAALVIVFALIVCLCVLADVILIYAWTIPEYRLWNIHTGLPTWEYIPQENAKALAILYGWDGSTASNFHVQIFNRLFTDWCGSHYTRLLAPDEKRPLIWDDWISKYNIDMNLFTPTDYNQYQSVNDFFTRRMNFSIPIRPVDYSAGNVISPCECRVLVYPNVDAATVWVKGDHYSVSDLLNGNAFYSAIFRGGFIYIGRLAPQDYHRFNSPIDGWVESYYDVSGEVWAVSAVAARSENRVFMNQRKVIILRTTGGARVAVIPVGSACVGSIVTSIVSIGQNFTRGQELGYFQFGGSTIIMLFQLNSVTFDSRLLYYSTFPVETFVHVNFAVGNNTLG